MNPESLPQSRKGRQLGFNLPQSLLSLFALTCSVQHLRHLVTGEHQPGQLLPCSLVICVQVGAPGFRQPPLAVFQHRSKLIEGIEQIILVETHSAFLVPDLWEVHPAFEVGYVDLRPLVERLHEQQLQQYAFSAPGGAAQQNVGDMGQVHRHWPRQALPQHQHEAVRG